MLRRLPRSLTVAAVAAASLALPSTALAGISIPLPPPSLKATERVEKKIVPVVAGDGSLWLCNDQTWECIPW